ncbi:MAG: metal-dependent hydrolase [Desulfobacteraceae bacterium]
MPTLITHPAVALGASPCLRAARRRGTIVLTGMLLTMLPDLDVVAFRFGIPYGHMLGHRGFSHSILFAVIVSALTALLFRQPRAGRWLLVWGYLFLCAVSHGLLDAMTNGGLGVGLLIPFSARRFFFGIRPIDVSPLSLERFLGGRGLAILQNELVVVWLPAAVLFVAAFWMTRKVSKPAMPHRLKRF